MSVEDKLIAKGWKKTSEFSGRISFTKGDTYKLHGQGAFLDLDTNDGTVKITTTGSNFNMDGPELRVLYDGLYQNEDTFNMICKLIDLKA